MAYFALPNIRLKNYLLVLASAVFYVWGETRFGWLILALICANYFFARLIENSKEKSKRVALCWLAISITTCLGSLIYFKYFDFLISNLNVIRAAIGQNQLDLLRVGLPLGISFISFHLMSYCIDVYRGTVKAQKDFLNTALYIGFFPQLIAGPIVRYHEIAAQLTERSTDLESFAIGVRRFIVGLAKKVLIADIIARPVDAIYALPNEQLNIGLAWFGALAFCLQIYYDLSAYSDMAIGLARMFGFKFPENFDYPYYAQSVSERWRRWHMSLTAWFRDYLYNPLCQLTAKSFRPVHIMYLVILLCGLWHGANWTFLFWAFYLATFMQLERRRHGRWLKNLPRPLKHIYALSTAAFAAPIFRSQDLNSAGQYILTMLGLHTPSDFSPLAPILNPEIALVSLVAVLACVPPEVIWNSIESLMHRAGFQIPARDGVIISLSRVSALSALLILSIGELASGTYNAFIYFRF